MSLQKSTITYSVLALGSFESNVARVPVRKYHKLGHASLKGNLQRDGRGNGTELD